jgi:hypothetical protein
MSIKGTRDFCTGREFVIATPNPSQLPPNLTLRKFAVLSTICTGLRGELLLKQNLPNPVEALTCFQQAIGARLTAAHPAHSALPVWSTS